MNDGYEPSRYNREDNNDGCDSDSPSVQGDNQPRGNNKNELVPEISHGIKIDKKINTVTQGLNCDIVDDQKRKNSSGQPSATGYKDLSQAQRLSMHQKTSSSPMESLNIPGSQ